MKELLSGLLLASLLAFQAGCTTPVPNDPELARIDEQQLPPPDLSLSIPGLSSCTTNPDTTLRLNSRDPVTVIVHGCFGSAARFRALAQVYAFHGQQAVCFNYNDRDSLMKSSSQLVEALTQLGERLDNPEMNIIGHSQGGLIARKALVREREKPWRAGDRSLRLVTISSPFGGIAAADHCASPTARRLSLGLVIPVCKLISGDKWYEITRPSPFIQLPGTFIPQVNKHLKIVTDETGSCRRYGDNGLCLEDDYVFSVAEQYFEEVDASPLVENIEVTAGHAEIVGDHRKAPYKLINLLQRKDLMSKTRSARLAALEALLTRLYRQE